MKLPGDGAKGVVTFTTGERDDVILQVPGFRERVERLKDRWVVGLHHNWHDWQFEYDPLFDFSMAGAEDLRERDGREFVRISRDACNFAPAAFHPGGEKFWDLLYVARPVFFKGIPEFLETIRALYDRGDRIRVLCICPMPPYDRSQRKTVHYDIRDRYDAMFDEEEQDLFTLLTLDYRWPFPFDLPSLGHFYRSSRVFAHFAPEERRCRVAAYAWASDVPVVGTAPVGSLLSPDLRKPPWFFEAGSYSEFPDRILEAIESSRQDHDFEPVRREVSAAYTRDAMLSELSQHFPDTRATAAGDGELAMDRLDIRLGRHHGADAGLNAVAMTLDEFVGLLERDTPELRSAVASCPDPELEVAGRTQWSEDRNAPRVSLPKLRPPRLPRRRTQASPQTAISRTVAAFAGSLPAGARVLDVGCGTKPYAPLFAQGEYVGIDVESSGRAAHEKTADVYFDGESIPFEDGEFDAALCTEVLEHAVHPDRLVGEIQRVLRSGGRLLVTVPFIWGEHETPYDFRRFSSFGIRRLVEEAGMRVESFEKLSPGVDGLALLVSSEMAHSDEQRPAGGRVTALAKRVLVRAWRLQLKLLRRQYEFERIYIDNALVAVKD